jgi:hypothetical protein
MTLRWRRQASEKGLARVCQSERGFDAGRPTVVSVRPYGRTGRWYWYGSGFNSLRNDLTYESAGQAKVAAQERFLLVRRADKEVK